MVLINNDPLLKPDERAVFSTHLEKGRHQIVGAKYGDMRVTTREQKEEIISRLRDGKKEYVPFSRTRDRMGAP